ncbi:MAG TPA: hypothetical protein VGD40_23095 [Chryseosolibacter sp.]
MNLDENTTKIVVGVLVLLTAAVGGAIISIRKSKNRQTRTHQENITIGGSNNKVVGGDDNSERK